MPKNKYTVVIDPGHGGPDPGAVGIAGVREKDIVNEISAQVRDILVRQGAKVVMTRSTDIDLDLQPRVSIAEQANATVFVSIHANAISLSRPDINGLESFYYSSASGKKLATDIHNAIMRELDMADRGVREANFYVIRVTSMPAALIETGFLTGAEDSLKLRNPVFRKDMSEGIAKGILKYLGDLR
ncbi:MAG: N-acetylmuramoyl-L-alanine amidase [Synechococcales cyanobacterium CRU_2_2]|nr:N-acetylmuramoyl-L-alanine amidase [Synechococcales cyanobacterium CRU_2_2]